MWLNLFRFLKPFCVHSSCHIYRSSLLKEHFGQKTEQSSSAGTIRAFVLCISAFVLFHALPPPISMQLKLQRPPSMGLLCGHRIETIQPLLFSALPVFFLTLSEQCMSPDRGPDVTGGYMNLPAVLYSARSLLELKVEGRRHQVCTHTVGGGKRRRGTTCRWIRSAALDMW